PALLPALPPLAPPALPAWPPLELPAEPALPPAPPPAAPAPPLPELPPAPPPVSSELQASAVSTKNSPATFHPRIGRSVSESVGARHGAGGRGWLDGRGQSGRSRILPLFLPNSISPQASAACENGNTWSMCGL